MPITVGIWIRAFRESLKDDAIFIKTALQVIDQSPLGSGAGFGVPIKIDRKLTAKLLKFNKVQSNPLYCQNSRGKFENAVVQAVGNVMLTLNKLATDVLLFTTKEFNFFSVSESLTTGSSMMPQKRNLDIAEILRGKTKLYFGYQQQIQLLSLDLMSGYNRDLQLTKKPLLEALKIAKESDEVAILLLSNIKPNVDELKKACEGNILATRRAYALVKKGIPFRQSYRTIKQNLI
jgi:argininosuccinate lyase